MRTEAVVGIAAAAIVLIIVLAVAFQYQQHYVSSQTPVNNALTSNSTLAKNRNLTTSVFANTTQTIPHIGKFINGTYAYYYLVPDKFWGSPEYLQDRKDLYFREGYRAVFEYLKFKGEVEVTTRIKDNNGTLDEVFNPAYPIYDVYFANESTGTVQNYFVSVVFDNYTGHHHTGQLFVKSFDSGFVWEIVTAPSNPGAEERYLVDAVSGQLIGRYTLDPGYV